MPRRARIALAGVPMHVIQRGNNRSACFFAEADYRHYLENLHCMSLKFDCAVHAFVLMTNHVHLLLTPARSDSASLLMKHLGQRYVQYINRQYRRSGTLWEGRFKSCVAQSEEYVLTCYRYIELNPVRAGMVMRPADYRWSSHQCNSLGEANPIVVPHHQFLRLSNDATARHAAYRALFEAPLDAESIKAIRSATNGNYALGTTRFQGEIESMLGRRVRPAPPGRPRLPRESSP